MSKKILQKDVIVKLIVGAGQASPSPPVGPALGSKGVKSMDFCKEFNARTSIYTPGIPIPALVTVRPDRSFHFETRTPPSAILLLRAAGVKEIKGKLRGAGNPPGPSNNTVGAKGKPHVSHPKEGNATLGTVGIVSLKHVYEIATIKRTEKRLAGLSQEAMVRSLVAQAAGMGVVVVP